jgi:hypothetical protein
LFILEDGYNAITQNEIGKREYTLNSESSQISEAKQTTSKWEDKIETNCFPDLQEELWKNHLININEISEKREEYDLNSKGFQRFFVDLALK